MELIYAIKKRNTTKALEIIESGQFNPDELDYYNNTTPLMYAIDYMMHDVALALIATGKSIPGHVDSSGYTALIDACQNNMPDIAMALIETGQSNPSHVNKLGNTALSRACYNNMPDIAMALIETGQSNPRHVNKLGDTALTIAKRHNMTDIIDALENYDNYMASLQHSTQSNPYDDLNYVMTIDI